jgi:choline dehydrogenase-like flavoprotein
MAEAHDALLLDAFDYHAGDRVLRQRAAGPDGAPFDEIRFKLSRLVPGTQAPYLGEYAEFLRAELKASANPRFVTGATVCQILLSEDRRRIEGLFALTFQGRELQLRAKAYVLATGGIETARLLLASREDMACGVGNEGDSVGRYFMEPRMAWAGCCWSMTMPCRRCAASPPATSARPASPSAACG